MPFLPSTPSYKHRTISEKAVAVQLEDILALPEVAAAIRHEVFRYDAKHVIIQTGGLSMMTPAGTIIHVE